MELYIAVVAVVIIATTLIYKRKKGEKEVPQGIQVFDENGNCIVDVTERINKYLGSFTIDGTADSGTVTNEELAEGDLWYAFEIKGIAGSSIVSTDENAIFSFPVITKGNGKLTWQYPHSISSTYRRYSVTVYYGVY